VLLPSLALAQGSIAGSVKDTTGALLPGVTVEAASPALIEKVLSVTTDGSGQYRIVDLRPGTSAPEPLVANRNPTIPSEGGGPSEGQGPRRITGLTSPATPANVVYPPLNSDRNIPGSSRNRSRYSRRVDCQSRIRIVLGKTFNELQPSSKDSLKGTAKGSGMSRRRGVRS
jgi:hypothetical protein